MVRLTPLLATIPLAAAWPTVMEEIVAKRAEPYNPSGRPNTFTPPTGFDEHEQFVDVRPGSGHEYIRPGPNDHRGQCPGLNAAANNGFLPRNGLLNPQQTADGLQAAYNMAPSQGIILSILSIALGGDIPSMTWSIGGKFEPSLVGGLLGNPQGLTGTHNEYEGDGSPVSGDAYMHDDKVGVFEMERWEALWKVGENGYSVDVLAQHNLMTWETSIAQNPNFFAGVLPGMIVIPGAHNFIAAFMSNHSAEVPGGYLDRETLKSFFGVQGNQPGEFTFDYATQQIPLNWYKMPKGNSYTIQQTAADALINGVLYPGVTRLGGNTNGVNTYAGVDYADLSGGLFNLTNLAEGNNAICFALQATMAGKVDQANVVDFMLSSLAGPLASLGCPSLGHKSFNMAVFDKFPGAKYRAPGYEVGQ